MKILAILFFLPVFLIAQELDAEVSVNMEKLPTANKDLLANFARDVENYLNNNKYSGDVWKFDKIKCSFNIFFMSASNETNYSAQVSVSSVRPVENSTNSSLMFNILDNSWEFIYERGQSLYFNQTFDPLTDFLDFYAYVLIGLNEDSYAQLGGSPYFKEAFNIALLGTNSTKSKGWEKNSNSYSRRGLVEDLVNENYRVFRENYFDYHFNGIDIFNSKKQIAQENIAKLILNLEKLRSKVSVYGVLLKTFFDAKSGEMVNYLADYRDKTIFQKLKKIDPPHITKYDEVLNN